MSNDDEMPVFATRLREAFLAEMGDPLGAQQAPPKTEEQLLAEARRAQNVQQSELYSPEQLRGMRNTYRPQMAEAFGLDDTQSIETIRPLLCPPKPPPVDGFLLRFAHSVVAACKNIAGKIFGRG